MAKTNGEIWQQREKYKAEQEEEEEKRRKRRQSTTTAKAKIITES